MFAEVPVIRDDPESFLSIFDRSVEGPLIVSAWNAHFQIPAIDPELVSCSVQFPGQPIMDYPFRWVISHTRFFTSQGTVIKVTTADHSSFIAAACFLFLYQKLGYKLRIGYDSSRVIACEVL